MGILIPLYTYPTSQTWFEVSVEKQRNPTVNITAVINPDNGVGVSSDANYIMGVKRLQLAGVTVLGYVATGYGARAMASIQAECARYAAWYSVDGIFFDEYQTGWQAPAVPGLSLGNPGTQATGNIPLVTYESAGMPSNLPPDANYIAHTVAALPSKYAKPSYYYITDDPATYQRLPTYFTSLVAGDTLMSNPGLPPQGKIMTLTIDGKTYSWQVT